MRLLESLKLTCVSHTIFLLESTGLEDLECLKSLEGLRPLYHNTII